MLSCKEKQMVLAANKKDNVCREDYAVPQKYGTGRCDGGENWDNFRFKADDIRTVTLQRLLDAYKPSKVLEIGPGAGYHTRLICEHNAVSEYTAIDIGRAFLDFLQPKLELVKRQKKFNYSLIAGEITEFDLPNKYDFIVLLSTVHHIPNRLELFAKLNDILADNGTIFCFDPSHYLPRIIGLLKK